MKRILIYFIIIITILLVQMPGSDVCYGITSEELQTMIGRQEGITIIDIRDNDAYMAGHIPGAINIPASLCPEKQLPPIGRVIVYGDGINESITKGAVVALNKKPGIGAEMLKGGIGRWEALNYNVTKRTGMMPENLPYISYQLLKAVVQNPEVVIVDLRNREKRQTEGDRPRKDSPPIDEDKKGLTDLSKEFPHVRIIVSPFESDSSEEPLKAGNGGHNTLYVLIDNGDGAAEDMARRLKAAGIKQFFILAGGEEILERKGLPGQKKQ